MGRKVIREQVSGQLAVIVNTNKTIHPWWWRLFTQEGRDYTRWERSLTDPVSGGKKGGVYHFPAKMVK